MDVSDLNIHNIVVASDSKGAVGATNNNSRGANGAIIMEINSIAIPINCKFNFEGRAVNVDAHRLTKFALSSGPGRHIWLGQSHDLRNIPHSMDFAE